MAPKSNKDAATPAPAGVARVALADLLAGATARGSRIATLDTLGDRCKWWMPTGNTALDRIFGNGKNFGMGSGIVYNIYGMSGSGKSLTCLSAAQAVERAGGIPIYVDMERTVGVDLGHKFGIRPERMVMLPNDVLLEELARTPVKNDQGRVVSHGVAFTIEAAFEEIEKFARNVRQVERAAQDAENAAAKAEKREPVTVEPTPLVFFYDSIASSTTRLRDKADYGDSRPGHLARALSDGLQQLHTVVKDTDSILVLVNQQRTNLSVTFGSNIVQPGGNAAEFYPDVRVYMKKAGVVKDGTRIIGEHLRVTTEKSRLWPGKHEAIFRVMYDRGVDDHFSVFTMAQEMKFLHQGGSWFELPGHGRWNGIDATLDAIRNERELYEKLRYLVLGYEPETTGQVTVEAVTDTP